MLYQFLRKIKNQNMIFINFRNYFNTTVNGTYWLDNVQCWGSEPDISACRHRGMGVHNCKRGLEMAGVVCTNITEADITKPLLSKASDNQVYNFF